MAIKTFTTGEILTAADTNTYLNNGGLVWISQTTISGTSTAISNCFSSTYDNYRVLIRLTSTSAGTIGLQLGSATTNYKSYLWTPFNTWTSGAAASQTSTAVLLLGYSQTNGTGQFDLYSPNLATVTWASGNYSQVDNGGIVAGYQTDSTAYTGCTIIAPTGASGTCWIYGYRKS